MLELSLQLHAVVFSPSDYAPTGYLFIVQRGLMVFRGKVLTKGKVWGEDLVLHSEDLRSTSRARAMNYVAGPRPRRASPLRTAQRRPATACNGLHEASPHDARATLVRARVQR